MVIEKVYLSEAGNKKNLNYDHLDTEVIVNMVNGSKYRASFISIDQLQLKIKEFQKNKPYYGRKYYWAKGLVIVNEVCEEDIIPMIEYMIEEGDFQLIFEKL